MPTIQVVDETLSVCHVRQRWADAWTELPLLEAIDVSDQVAPSHPTATFNYEYGSVKFPEIQSRLADTGWTTEPPPDLGNWYVRIATVNWLWYGVFLDAVNSRDGDLNLVPVVPSGTVEKTAYGLSVLLDRMSGIRRSKVTAADEWIELALAFNAGLDGRPRDDRPTSSNKSDAGLWFADPVSETVEDWTAANVIDYLFANFTPANKDGTVRVPWGVIVNTPPATPNAGLDYALPSFEYDGETIWDILPRLITRGRGLGFNTKIVNTPTVTLNGTTGKLEFANDNGTEECRLNIWSYLPVGITLPGGTEIPANINQGNLNVSSAVNITAEKIVASMQQVYHQVKVIGAPRGSVCTLIPLNDLETEGFVLPAWKTAGETAYNEARSGDADYGTLTDEDKTLRNQEYRNDDKFYRVFSWWFVDGNWNRKQKYDDGTTITEHFIFPKILPNGNLSTTEETFQWVAAMRISEMLPMKAGIDYSGAVTPATSQTNDEADYLPMAVWFEHTLAEHLDFDSDLGVAEPRVWNVQTRPLKDWPGLSFRVSGGLQHYIAEDLYTPNGTYEQIETTDRAIEHNEWAATVYIQGQERVTEVYPSDANVADVDVLNVFEIEMPDAHFDVLVPGTYVGIDWDGNPLEVQYKQAAGGWLRDDRKQMKDEARLAWSWVSEPRRILELAWDGAAVSLPVGDMITTVGVGGVLPVLINSVITEVKINLKESSGSLKTQAAELDGE